MTLGARLRLFGEVKFSRYGVQMAHPEYNVVAPGAPVVNTGLQPIYPTVKGLHQINYVLY
ncbi:ATP-dependent DNA helicase recG [Psychrobacter phenylpyruvicus]|uniref:ATP-dependent DNA helicase recG n=1 Tax=Psychrobacter phenylpyruvicus TaxID=29432 RepID=A0A379LGN0_9GAMM|nr:ATP-dependent DNA helicase recG [Psychrobacter phenylpyruvicus]